MTLEFRKGKDVGTRKWQAVAKLLISNFYFLNTKWGCSSAGRAPALQAGGQRFEPAQLHQDRN